MIQINQFLTNIVLTDWRIWLASGITSTFYGFSIIFIFRYLNTIDYVNEYKIKNLMNISEKKNESIKEEDSDFLHLPMKTDKKTVDEEDIKKEKERIKFENEKIQLKANYIKKTTIVNFISSMILFTSYMFGFAYGLINLFCTSYFDIIYNNNTFLEHQDIYDKIIVMFIIQGFVWDIVAGFDFYPQLMQKRLFKNLLYTASTIYAMMKNNIKFMSLAYICEFTDIIVFGLTMCDIHIEKKRDRFIFYVYHFFFKIVFPIVCMIYINVNKLNLVFELQSLMLIKIWYEICLFTIFITDKYFVKNKEIIQNEKIVAGKAE